MKFNKKILRVTIIVFIIIIIFIGLLIIENELVKRAQTNSEIQINIDGVGGEYDRSHLNNIDLNLYGMTDDLLKKVKDEDNFYIELKEYIYLKGITDAKNVTVKDWNIEKDKLIIKFQLDNSSNDNIRAIMDLDTKDIYFDELLNDDSRFFIIENKINEFFSYIGNKNSEAISSVVDIANSDINSFIKNNINVSTFKIKEAYTKKLKKDIDAVNIYFIEGTGYFGQNNMNKNQIYIICVEDYINKTYCMIPIDYMSDIDVLKKINYQIETNDYNRLDTTKLDDVKILQFYFDRYIFYELYESKYIYDFISNKTDNSKTTTISEFENYVNSNFDDIKKLEVIKYKIEEENGKKIYTLIDNNYNIYKFYITNILDYEVMIQIKD